jgi:hypothetical protein
LAAASGIDTTGLIKTEEELAAEQKQAQMQAMQGQIMQGGMDMVSRNPEMLNSLTQSQGAPLKQ